MIQIFIVSIWGAVVFLVYKIQPFQFYVNSSFVLSFTEAILGFHDNRIHLFTFNGAWMAYLIGNSPKILFSFLFSPFGEYKLP